MDNNSGSNIFGSQNAGSETGQLLSRIEIVRNILIREFDQIKKDNGYRNDVVDVVNAIRPLTAITQFPEIGIEIGNCQIKLEDAAWNVSEAICDVYVQCAVQSVGVMGKDQTELNNSVESMRHDILKCLYGIFTKYIVGVENWNVLPNSVNIYPMFDFGTKQTKAMIQVEFKIQLRSLTKDF